MRKVMATAIAGVLALGLAGCSKAENKGLDTTCGDFIKMDSSQQVEVMKKIAADEGETLDSDDEAKTMAGLIAMVCGAEDANTKLRDIGPDN